MTLPLGSLLCVYIATVGVTTVSTFERKNTILSFYGTSKLKAQNTLMF
jgi:hypothetical protein